MDPSAAVSPGCIVFGATGGIGSALARRLAAKGWRLLLASRNPDKLKQISQELGVACLEADATDAAWVEDCFTRAGEMIGPINGVCNCVGSLLLKSAHQTSAGEWAETLSTNLSSAFFVVRSASKAMLRTGGSIVLVSSAAARIGLPNHEAIAAAKAGVIGLTLSAAASYSRYKIRVNCVAPGLVRSPMTARLTENETSLKASEAMHALGRIGEPQDVAAAIEWFLDPVQSWVTGQVLGVDGGLGSLRTR